MHYIFSGSAHQYASAASSVRGPDGVTRTPSIYLGKIIDLENGIFKSKERGFFSFDINAGEFRDLPDHFVFPASDKEVCSDRRVIDFGDIFFLDNFFWQSGLNTLIDSIPWKEKDTLYALICFYMVSTMANCDCHIWYIGNVAKNIYPNAVLCSQRISECLAFIGQRDTRVNFLEAYSSYILKNYCPDTNILIDSSGLPNSIHMSDTQINVHNNVVSNETRLIFVVQKSTGLPIFYDSVPGNIVDVSTLGTILEHLKAMHIDIDSCLIDAGYDSADNLDLFYEEHSCRIGYITRASSRDKRLQKMIRENIDTIDDGKNLVKYLDRYLFIVKQEITVGRNQDNPGWMYLGLDLDRARDEQKKLMKRAKKDHLSTEDVWQALQTEGFFGIISGKEYEVSEILPFYYQRQQIEQTFDIAKNYVKILPLRNHTSETYQGHLLISFIASCAMKMIQLGLGTADLLLGSRITALRNEKCTVYSDRIVPDPLYPEARAIYEAFQIPYPKSLRMVNGKIQYRHPKPQLLPQAVPSKRRPGRPPGAKNKKTLEREAQQSAQRVEAEAEVHKKRGRGRPPGAKNKKTLEREAQLAAEKAKVPEPSLKKRGRGRPPGSKNKKTLEREAQLAAEEPKVSESSLKKRGRGRPPGSKNKKTLEREAQLAAQQTETPNLVLKKRGRGRPPGSKNKKTLECEELQAVQED